MAINLRVTTSAFLAIVCAVLTASCRKAQEPGEKEAGPVVPKLALVVDSKTVELPLEVMDVFLVKRGDAPEAFEIRGNGVMLAGSFPSGVKVDYGEHWEVLVGKTIAISSKGGEHYNEKNSELTLPGQGALPVIGGSFVVEQVTGETTEKGAPLKGTIQVKCKTSKGEQTFRGTFIVLAKTWG